MKHLSMTETTHAFRKTNLVGVRDNRGIYDEYECENCHIRGKRRSLNGSLLLDGRSKATNQCPKAPERTAPKKIRILECTAFGVQFANLTPGSIHDVVEAPEGGRSGETGYWVQGVSEPVLVFFKECEVVE